jgi:uncharacterized coiled-coil protein SlyX
MGFTRQLAEELNHASVQFAALQTEHARLREQLAAMTAELDALKESIRGALICAKNKKMRVTEQERLDMVAALLTGDIS